MKTWNPYSSKTLAQLACIALLSGCVLLAGCRRKNRNFAEPAQPAFLSIAEANWSNGSSQIEANSTPDSKAISTGNGLSTQFSDGDRLGLFLRGDSYEPVDNRMVTYTPEEGDIITKWVIDGDPITLYQNEATLTAYFPYSEYGKLLMDSIPLVAGAYDVNTNDVVWQRDKVHSTHTQAMFLNMQHAMTRVKLIFSKAPATDPTTYLGAGKIEAVQIADANTVAEEDQVIYVDGFLNLETETPTILPAVRGRVIISATKTLSEEGVLYDFLLLPVATINPGAVQLHILIDDKTITTEFPTSLINAWKAGTAYTYEVTVRNGDSQVVFGKVGTTPWNYGGKISGDLDPSNPEYGGGDVEDWGNNGWGVEIDNPGKFEVSPDPTSIPYEGEEFTVTWTRKDASVTVPVRVIEEGQDEALASGEVTSTSPEVKLTVPENSYPNPARTIVFQYQWKGQWKEFDRGTQQERPLYIETATVSPDPTNFSYAAKAFTVTLTGAWDGSVPVRAIIDENDVALVSGSVTTSGTSVKLTVPANAFPNAARTIVFQYQWEGKWVEIDRGTQAAEPASITAKTVSPDPTNFSSAATTFTVTLTGKWSGSVPIRAIVNGSSTLVSGSVTTSGTGVKLTVPNNAYPNPARTIVFQYQWDNKWVEIDRGVQQEGEKVIDVPGGGIEISPETGEKMTWDEAVAYCKNKSTGWRLPTANELMYLWCINPSLTGEAAFAAGMYWAATQSSSLSTTAWGVDFIYGASGSNYNKTNSFYVRCVRDKGTSGTYPYITTATGGVVIVLRDDKGGVDEANLFSSRQTASPTGAENSTDNRMSRKFRVQKANPGLSKTWDDAVSYCDNLTEEGYSNWRLPTQRELQLIWLLGGNSNVTSGDKNDTGVGSGSVPLYTPYLYQQSGFTAFAADVYWLATHISSGGTDVWVVSFHYGNTFSSSSWVSSRYVRCVRDEW